MGSAGELEYHILLARDLKLIQPKDYDALHQRTTELKRMLMALRHKLNADRSKLTCSRFQVSLAMVR
jgi:four helix bundle protein